MSAVPVRFPRSALALLLTCAWALLALTARPAQATVTIALSSGYVTPTSGDTTTHFTYRVKYWNTAGALPDAVKTATWSSATGTRWFTMWPLEPADGNTVDGKWYTLSLTLAAGSYAFRFAAQTGAAWVYFPDPAGTYASGPTVTQANPVSLTGGYVTPTSGANSTTFSWRVKYWNANNAPPDEVKVGVWFPTLKTTYWYAMYPYNPTDTNYRDGAVYAYSRKWLPPGTYAYRCAARQGSNWAYWPTPAGAYASGPTVASDDETAIRNVFQQWEQYMEAENLTATMSLFSGSFLHTGANKTATSANIADFFATYSGIAITATNLVITITGDTATASFHLTINTDQRVVEDRDWSPQQDDMGFCFLRKESGVWRFYGNQQWYGTRAFSAYSAPPNYWLELWVWDPTHRATSATVSGPGIPANTPLTWQSWGGEWSWSANPGLPTPPPTPPMTYTFTITDASGVTVLQDVVEGYCTQLATNLSPSGGQTVVGTPTFTWTGVSLPGATYAVEVNDASWNRVWQVYDLTATTVPYGGPPLTAGALYNWDVVVTDTDGNISVTSETFHAG